MLRRIGRQLIQCSTWPIYFALRAVDAFGKRVQPAPRANGAKLPPYREGISVIIPERANPELLGECLLSLQAACAEVHEPCEVIVVASGSPESLYASLMFNFDSVRWVFSRRPLHFNAAIRRGLAEAQYDWVYLLNNDMVVDRAAIVSLLPWRAPSVFAIASQIFFKDPEKRREETGWTVFKNDGGPIEILDRLPESGTNVRGSFYAGGGASLFRRQLLAEAAADSAVYDPFYWEDVEWGARAWWSGYQVLFCPSSKVWHAHRATNRRFFQEREIDRIQQRNRLLFHFRNGPNVRSLAEFERIIAPFHRRSLLELMSPGRFARIVIGRLRNNKLPFRELALEYTWCKYYLRPPGLSQAKPCVLMAVPYAIFPPSHGGARRIHGMMEALCERFEIVLLSDEVELYTAGSVGYFAGLSSVHLVGGRPDGASLNDRTGRIAAHSHSVLIGHLTFLMAACEPAAVQIEYMELAKVVESRNSDSCPWFLTAHDVLSSEDQSEARHDANQRRWLNQFDAVIACSDEDARLLRHDHVFTIPNGAALDGRYIPSPPRAPILFLGPFRYSPNLAGIQEFLRDCWARLRTRVPWAELWILGGDDAPSIAFERDCFKQEGVRVFAYTENPREWLDRCALTINPLRNVRGSCLKVIESVAAGRACVSTRDGARGYLDRGFDALVVNAAVADFVGPVERLLIDDDYRHSLEAPPQQTLEPYSWKIASDLQAGLYEKWMTKS